MIKAIWLSAEQPCGKRLKAALPLWLPFYEKRHGQLESKVKAKVLAASARPPLTGCWRPAGSLWVAGVAAARVRAHCCAVRSPFAPSTGR